MALRDDRAAGFEVAFHGEYREILPGERLVTTEVFEGAPPSDAATVLNTVDFVDLGGRTTRTSWSTRRTQEIRDLMTGSGMEVGMQEQYDELDALVASLRVSP